MPKIKFLICFTLLWIMAGCQHSGVENAAAPFAAESPASSDHTASAHLEKNSIPNVRIDSKEDSSRNPELAPEVVMNNPLSSNRASKGTSSAQCLDAAAQGRIDQALELCNVAQQRWEEGKLEEAISSLDSAYFSILEIDSENDAGLNQQKEDVRYLISKRILEIYASRQIAVSGQHNEIPIVLNQYVEHEIKRLTGPERRFFEQSLERAGRFRPYIVAELKKAGLPEELSWLPLIESGYKIRALSPARALGLWQFIPSTGHKFGLSRNYYVDERLDPEKSTQAAIAYLKELHNLFGDWSTVLAAYNCGESRVLSTIRRQKINYLDNFWDLYQSLPRETSRYVPRFLATLHIVNNLEKYAIAPKNISQPVPYEICEINKQLHLKDISRALGVDLKQIKDLNPELRYSVLPPETYQLRIPSDKAQLFVSKVDELKATPRSLPPMFVYHRVKRGDTLSGIAKRYKTSVWAISKANKIGRSNRIIVGHVLKIPGRKSGSPTQVAASGRKSRASSKKQMVYRVKAGDNLWKLANRFGTTTKQIMKANRLSSTRLNVGQRLTIWGGSASSTSKSDVYQVRMGDSPFSIALKHKMPLDRLLALNHLSRKSKIFPGQRLVVE